MQTQYHWIAYEGGLVFFDKNKSITKNLKEVESLSFKIFTWGRNPKTAEFRMYNGTVKVDMDVNKLITSP